MELLGSTEGKETRLPDENFVFLSMLGALQQLTEVILPVSRRHKLMTIGSPLPESASHRLTLFL